MAADTPDQQVVNEVTLRSRSPAASGPDNIGHFGLALTRYAHFTSPIRALCRFAGAPGADFRVFDSAQVGSRIYEPALLP